MVTDWNVAIMMDKFTAGQAAFYTGGVWEADNIAEVMEDEYGVLVMPKGPSADGYSGRAIMDPYVMPSAFDDETKIKFYLVLLDTTKKLLRLLMKLYGNQMRPLIIATLEPLKNHLLLSVICPL